MALYSSKSNVVLLFGDACKVHRCLKMVGLADYESVSADHQEETYEVRMSNEEWMLLTTVLGWNLTFVRLVADNLRGMPVNKKRAVYKALREDPQVQVPELFSGLHLIRRVVLNTASVDAGMPKNGVARGRFDLYMKELCMRVKEEVARREEDGEDLEDYDQVPPIAYAL